MRVITLLHEGAPALVGRGSPRRVRTVHGASFGDHWSNGTEYIRFPAIRSLFVEKAE
jgi:hypothetical protein